MQRKGGGVTSVQMFASKFFYWVWVPSSWTAYNIYQIFFGFIKKPGLLKISVLKNVYLVCV